jgi:hypothetical protein
MPSRTQTITQNILICPSCSKDYSKTTIIERFDKCGNIGHMAFVCDCKRKLSLRLMVNGWFKIYDITDAEIRKNYNAKMQRLAKRQLNGAI